MNIFLIFLLSFDLILCAHIESVVSHISSNLIKNLNAKDLGEKFTETNQIFAKLISVNSSQYKKLVSITMIPYEILCKIFEYLDHDDIKTCTETSKAFQDIGNCVTRRRLNHLSYYFVFQNDWLNRVFLHELGHYFHPESKITDKDIYDQFEVACINENAKNSVTTAKRIKYLFQAFIHEFLYGSESLIPQNVSEWKMYILIKLTENKYELSMSLGRLIEINTQIIEDEFHDPDDQLILSKYLELFLDFITAPLTIENYRAFEVRKHRLNLDARLLQVSFENEFQLLLQIFFHQDLVGDESVINVLKSVYSNGLFCKSLFERGVQSSQIAHELLKDPELRKNRIFIKHCLDKKFNINVEYGNIWTRNPKGSSNAAMLNKQLYLSMVSVCSPNLSILNTLIKSNRLGRLDINLINLPSISLTNNAYFTGHDAIFDILLNESGQKSANVLFYLTSPFEIVNIFNFGPMNPTKFEIYLKYLITKDFPLPLLFINFGRLIEFKHLIFDKFSMNKRYKLDFKFGNLVLRNFNPIHNVDLNIQTFKEINLAGLLDIFTSRTEFERMDESEQEIQNVSIKNFINFT